ncbi:chorismate mutase [Acaryochloris sp. IP29b_bin.148]|uniref:chorismate mutase n=1 Tax=Acaryochloris sp. IP29b_bin.148 TaxID=2969218 RepID=UPI0026300379|nr:chorismate mutase [Acaryochloris sp. IP29b_bin.148]
MEDNSVSWRVRAIRGATTAAENSVVAIQEAVNDLMAAIETENNLDLNEIISVTFSVTRDLDVIFPAAIARQRPNWENVPLLDVQQMYVESDLDFCIRCLIHFNTPNANQSIHHIYQREAKNLRPDWGLAASRVPSPLPSR